jgi:hypothetical protein
MSSKNRKQKQTTTTAPTQTVDAPATVTPEGTAKAVIIASVKAGVKYRGAREAWYKVLCAHEGKPAADYLAHCTQNPPSTPKSGVVEKASGWLRYFLRSGVVTLQ